VNVDGCYVPKFKIDDVVIYYGRIRHNCTHNNDECGWVLKRPNSTQPYYLIAVMAYDGSLLITNTFNYLHLTTFLATEDQIQLWKPNQ
jgi:hypothetical protein